MLKSCCIKPLCVIPLVLALSACNEDMKVVNKIMLVHTLGYDTDGSNIRGSVLIGDYAKKNEVNATIWDTVTTTEQDVIHSLNSKTKKPIEYGQLGIVIFGKSYAKKGINRAMDNICRESRLSTDMQLAVASDTALELLQAAKSRKDAYILSDVIEQNIKNGDIPTTNLHRALFSYYGEGRDVILPHLTKENSELKLDGLALFQGEKYILHIDLKSSLLLKIMMENVKNGSFTVPVLLKDKIEAPATFHIIKSSKAFHLMKSSPTPSISIDLTITAKIQDIPNVLEYRAASLIPEIQRSVAVYLEQQIQNLLSSFKEQGTDPIGLEEYVMHETGSKQVDMSQMDTNVSVNLDLVQIGYSE